MVGRAEAAGRRLGSGGTKRGCRQGWVRKAAAFQPRTRSGEADLAHPAGAPGPRWVYPRDGVLAGHTSRLGPPGPVCRSKAVASEAPELVRLARTRRRDSGRRVRSRGRGGPSFLFPTSPPFAERHDRGRAVPDPGAQLPSPGIVVVRGIDKGPAEKYGHLGPDGRMPWPGRRTGSVGRSVAAEARADAIGRDRRPVPTGQSAPGSCGGSRFPAGRWTPLPDPRGPTLCRRPQIAAGSIVGERGAEPPHRSHWSGILSGKRAPSGDVGFGRPETDADTGASSAREKARCEIGREHPWPTSPVLEAFAGRARPGLGAFHTEPVRTAAGPRFTPAVHPRRS